MPTPWVPAADEMVMIRPCPLSTMPGSTAWQQCSTPSRLTSIGPRQSSGSVSVNFFGSMASAPPLPALLTSTSTGPRPATAASTASRSVTSNGAAVAWPPLSTMSATIFSARSARRSLTSTRAPAVANIWAIPAPMFWPPPVTSAMRPVRSNTTFPQSFPTIFFLNRLCFGVILPAPPRGVDRGVRPVRLGWSTARRCSGGHRGGDWDRSGQTP